MCNAVAKRRKRIDGEQLEKVEEYKYLGRLITPGKKYRRELHQLGRDLDSTERSLEIRECPCPMCLKKEDHEHCHITSNALWSRNVVTYLPSDIETGCNQRSMERSMLGDTKKD